VKQTDSPVDDTDSPVDDTVSPVDDTNSPVDDTVLQRDRLVDGLPQLVLDRVESCADSCQQLTLDSIQHPLHTSSDTSMTPAVPALSSYYELRELHNTLTDTVKVLCPNQH